MWSSLLLTFICDHVTEDSDVWLDFMCFAFGSYAAGYYCGSTYPCFLDNILGQFRRSEGQDMYLPRVTSEILFQIIGSTAMMCLGPSPRSVATRCRGVAGSWESMGCRRTRRWKRWVSVPPQLSPGLGSISTYYYCLVLSHRSYRRGWRPSLCSVLWEITWDSATPMPT